MKQIQDITKTRKANRVYQTERCCGAITGFPLFFNSYHKDTLRKQSRVKTNQVKYLNSRLLKHLTTNHSIYMI